MANNSPKLHNAAWPGVVGKGEGSEPPIGLDTMLELTAAAEVNGQREAEDEIAGADQQHERYRDHERCPCDEPLVDSL